MRISIDDLADAIRHELRQYTDEVQEDVTRAVEETAREVKDIVVRTSPVGATGKYKKGWRIKYVARGNFISATIHGAKPTYRLAHLLSKGHAKRSGGRVPAVHDIQLAEDFGKQQLVNRVEDAIRKASR